MSAGLSTEFEDFSIFEVSFSLTAEGYANWSQIVCEMYEYLNFLKNIKQDDYFTIWKDLKLCADLEFVYQEKSEVLSLAPALASNLNFYPEEHVISVGNLFDEIDTQDVEIIRKYVEIFTPEYSVNILRSQVSGC